MDEASMKAELLELVKAKAVVREKRQLTSGKQSDFYIDGKQVTLDSRGLFLLGKVILSMLHSVKVDAIGGPTLGADPIAAAVSLLSSQTGRPLKAFLVRKEAKKHGMQRMIEGPPLQAGDQVVIVEDVITTGGSVLQAVREVEKLKAKIIRIICLVDRNEGSQEALVSYPYTPIFTLEDLSLQ